MKWNRQKEGHELDDKSTAFTYQFTLLPLLHKMSSRTTSSSELESK
jgi:hypothetical protein